MSRSAVPSALHSRANTARFVLAGVVLIAAQLALSFRLRHFNFFNDDLEHLAYGRFFSSLYQRQFDVHMPLGALISFLWGHLFGFTIESNRMLAAALNSGVLITQLHLGRRYLSSLAVGVVGASAYLLLQVPLWAYLHLSEVPSALFMLLGTSAVLRLESSPGLQGLGRAGAAFGAGALFGLALMARLLAIEVFALVVLIILVTRVLGRAPSTPWLRLLVTDALWVTLGLALPFLAFVGLFAVLGTLKDFIYWTLLHNMHAKGGYLDPSGWIGHLTEPDIQTLWLFALCSLFLSLVGYIAHWRLQQRPVRAALWLVWAGAIGGWLGANPSGIGQLAFHAIPAFPFLGLAAGSGLVGMTRWARMSQHWVRRVAWTAALFGSLSIGAALWRPLRTTWKLGKAAPVQPEFAWTLELGHYIRQNSQPQDSLFVFGTCPLLYVSAERNSATTFSIVFMDTVPYEEELLAQLRATPPRFVVVNPKDFWFSHNIRTMPRVRDYLLENYRVSNAFPELLEPRTIENQQRVFQHPELPASVAGTPP